MRIVCDSSALIALERINYLWLLESLSEDIIIILVDKKARKFAEKEGLKVAGLPVLLIRAKKKGIIEKVKPIIDDLRRHSFFMGEDIYLETLELSGEL